MDCLGKLYRSVVVGEATLSRGESDRDDKREVAVRNFGWRWRKRYSSLDQVERLGIENGRSRTLNDLAAYDFALSINCKRDASHTLDPARLRWIVLQLCKAPDCCQITVAEDTAAEGEGAVATGGASRACD